MTISAVINVTGVDSGEKLNSPWGEWPPRSPPQYKHRFGQPPVSFSHRRVLSTCMGSGSGGLYFSGWSWWREDCKDYLQNNFAWWRATLMDCCINLSSPMASLDGQLQTKWCSDSVTRPDWYLIVSAHCKARPDKYRMTKNILDRSVREIDKAAFPAPGSIAEEIRCSPPMDQSRVLAWPWDWKSRQVKERV